MESIICFTVGVFFGILLVALMEQARVNTEYGHCECWEKRKEVKQDD